MGANTIQYDRGDIEDQVNSMSGRMAGGGVFGSFLFFLSRRHENANYKEYHE